MCPPVFLHHGHVQIPTTSSVAQVVLLKQTGQLHSVRAAHSCHFLSTALQKPTQLIAPGRSEILQNHFKFPFIIHLGRRSLIAPSLRTSRLKFEVFELWPKEVILPDDYLHNHKNPSHSALSVFSTPEQFQLYPDRILLDRALAPSCSATGRVKPWHPFSGEATSKTLLENIINSKRREFSSCAI